MPHHRNYTSPFSSSTESCLTVAIKLESVKTVYVEKRKDGVGWKKLDGGGLATDSILGEAWLKMRRQRAGESRFQEIQGSCSVFSVVMQRLGDATKTALKAGGKCSGGWRLEEED
ncbi:hypothetical protein Bca52824_023833 [Brassica carinata]|uniref:Uncharacterized protein n=1 Tax=Brassica carinata TaxID=52824 RepID=A0A8X7VJC4_BRACI|nr:hypothetical protein Bca52824_023833 [Brassica carinata]